MFARLYTPFAFFGAMSFSAAFFMGFRHEPGAPAANILYNILLFAIINYKTIVNSVRRKTRRNSIALTRFKNLICN